MDTAASLPPYVDKGAGLVVVAWVEAGLGLALLAARIYTRARIVRKMGWDDWTMIVATILAVVASAIVTMEVHYGVGKHAAYIPPPDLIKAVKWIWLSAPFSTMSACFGKISIALLIMRINGNRNKPYTIFLWVLIVLLFIINLLLSIITFAQCTPVYWLWEQLNPISAMQGGGGGSCWDPNIQKNYGYFQGAFSALSDLILALFPILIIKNLKLDLKVKIGLCAVMGLGIIATVAACIKTVALQNLATPDFTYNAIELVYWFMTENWAIVIAACIPTLGPLYFIVTGQRTAASFNAAGGPLGGGAGGHSAGSGGGSSRRGLLSWGRKGLRLWSGGSGGGGSSAATKSVDASRGGGGGGGGFEREEGHYYSRMEKGFGGGDYSQTGTSRGNDGVVPELSAHRDNYGRGGMAVDGGAGADMMPMGGFVFDDAAGAGADTWQGRSILRTTEVMVEGRARSIGR